MEAIRFKDKIVNNGGRLIISFTGMRPANIQGFDFEKSFDSSPHNHLYCRDLSCCWYHGNGLGNMTGIDRIVEELKTRCARMNPSSISVIGGSMGGYAAILFGSLIEANDVVAIAPQTYLGRWKRFMMLNHEFNSQILKLHGLEGLDSRYLDLKKVLEECPSGPAIQLHCPINRIDASHAFNIASYKNLQSVIHWTHRHDLATAMRESAILPNWIDKFINPEGDLECKRIWSPNPYAAIRSLCKGVFTMGQF